MTAGVPQGSVLGPLLCNAMYAELLRVAMLDGVELIAFADNVLVMVIINTTMQLKQVAEEAMHHAGLVLATEKSQTVYFI